MWQKVVSLFTGHKIEKSTVRKWIKFIAAVVVLALFVRVMFFEPYKIPSSSMVPALIPGDKIFVTKVVYGLRIPFVGWRIAGGRMPQRGEVAVFISPTERYKYYIKRIVGMPGDTIEIKRGAIYVNGTPLSDPLISKNYYYNDGDYAKDGHSTKVPEGQYFMLGDNSASSRDGRYWGFVPYRDVIGKALFIWWPPKRIRMIQ
jgi:signal peptidase I